MNQQYQIKPVICDCHAETCCCDPWKVVDSKDKVVATFYRREDAANLLNLLGKETTKG